MGEKRYIISDASKMLNVESHVLRYWEEELEIKIPRNEMGHRYYTEGNLESLRKVRDLKKQGYSLKAIKNMVNPKKGARENKESNERLTVRQPISLSVYPVEVTKISTFCIRKCRRQCLAVYRVWYRI